MRCLSVAVVLWVTALAAHGHAFEITASLPFSGSGPGMVYGYGAVAVRDIDDDGRADIALTN